MSLIEHSNQNVYALKKCPKEVNQGRLSALSREGEAKRDVVDIHDIIACPTKNVFAKFVSARNQTDASIRFEITILPLTFVKLTFKIIINIT